ncbi:hypothetical protein J007_06140 [Cryptococcus neoformans]|nr:hypothetical protein J007_06140 [Cryptococcus neoformans var. grubii]
MNRSTTSPSPLFTRPFASSSGFTLQYSASRQVSGSSAGSSAGAGSSIITGRLPTTLSTSSTPSPSSRLSAGLTGKGTLSNNPSTIPLPGWDQ